MAKRKAISDKEEMEISLKKDKKAKIDVEESKIMSNGHRRVSKTQLMSKYQEVILLQYEKIEELEYKVNTYFISRIY